VFSQGLGMRLRGAYLTFHRFANSQFELAGITADQFVLMSILAEEPGLSQREIVDRAHSDANTVGAILKRLEGKRLVKREAHPSDGRIWCVFLTELGIKRQRQASDESRELHEKLIGLFTPKEQELLGRLLARIPPAMTAARGGAPEEAA
jgi:DNA-binding MarR family transcriptional regulator